MSGKRHDIKKIALLGMLTALALIFSFVESLIPMPVGIPGIKIGLANIVVLYTLVNHDFLSALSVSVARVCLAGLLFANMASIMYSLSGAVVSIIVMYVAYRVFHMHIVTASICGAIGHIIGQMTVAAIITTPAIFLTYAPPLLVVAFVTGALIGVLVMEIDRRIKV